MTRILSIIFTCVALTAPSVQLQFNLGNFSSQNLTNRKVLVTPLTLTNTPGIVSSYDPIYYTTTNSGYFWISNMISGTYLFEVQAPPVVSKYKLMIPGGTTNVVADSRLITTTNATDAQSFAYTIGAMDAILAGAGISSGIKAGTNITTITNGAEITINADVSHVEVSNATNGLKALLESEIVGSTNGYVRNFADTNTPTALTNILLSLVPSGVVTNHDTRPVILENTLNVSNTVIIGGGGIGAVQIADGDVIANHFIATKFGGEGPGFAGDGGGLSNGTPATFFGPGTIPTARLGSGTANSATYLRGDQTWATPSSSGSVTSGTNIYVSGGTVSVVAAPALNGANITNVTADYFSTTGQSNVTVLSSNQTELIFQNSNHYAGSFTGNGAGLTNVDTTGLVQTTRAVNTVSPLEGGGALSSDLTLTILQATASQAGALDPSNFLTFSRKWDANGNDAGASGFLGTTNLSNLRLKANGSVVMEYRTNGTVLAGAQNSDSFGVQSVVLSPFGGNTNSGATNSSILGGSGNSISNATLSVIAGGGTNRIAGSDASYNGSFIGAGLRNTIQSGAGSSVIVGGVDNTISVNGVTAVIVGGEHNAVSATAGLDQQFIGGGSFNTAIGDESAIVAGSFNTSAGNASFLGGGANNLTVGTASFLGSGVLNIANGVNSVVVGGNSNTSTNSYVSIGGGYGNSASGPAATIPGGSNNIANGAYSFAAGQSAKATNNGSFVWSDSQPSVYPSTNNDSFNVRAQGGAKFKADVEAAWGNTFYGNGGGLSNISVTIKVFTNGTAVGPNGSISTVGTTTCGLQEAINALPVSVSANQPGGGVIELQTGVYYISTNIFMSNFFGAGLMIRGAGMNVSGITCTSTNKECLRIVDDSTDRSSVFLRDMWFSSTTNFTTNLVFISTYGRIDIDHCWFAPWEAMTNNQVFGSSHGLTTATQGTFNQNHRPNLVGLNLAGSGDQAIINGCNFLSLASGINTIADHNIITGCEFSYIGANGTNNWTTNSWQFSLKAAICVPAGVSGAQCGNNFFYQCQACYLVGAGNTGTFVCSGDQYENSINGFLISPFARAFQYGLNSQSAAPPDSLISINPYALVSGIESYRIFRQDFNRQQATWVGGIIFGAGALTFSPGGLSTFVCIDSPTNGINVTYTNTTAFSAGISVFTNAATGFYVVSDPFLSVNTCEDIELWNAQHQEIYAFLGTGNGGDGIIFQQDDNCGFSQAGTGTPVLRATYTNATLTGSFDGSGVTNLNASSLSSGTVPVPRLPAGLSTSNYVGTFTGNGAGITNVTSITTNAAPCFTVTNPIVSGVRWTNNTGTIGLLSVNYTLNDSSISGDPGLCMTNTTVGEWFNATNNFVLTVNIPGSRTFRMGTNEVFICTNKSSGSATVTLDGSWFRP